MNKFTQTYITIWIIVLVLFGASLKAVTAGNGTFRFMGSKMELAQFNTYQLYKVTDNLAFEIGKEYISLVSFEKTSGLYALAGDYQHAPVDAAGSVFMVSADYQKDDYIYSTYPMGQTTVINIKSGERLGKLVKADPLAADFKPVNASQLPEYRQRGLVFDEQYKLSPAKIMAQYPPLKTYNENLFVVQAAFGLIFIVLILAGIPILISRFKASSAA